MAVSHYTYPGAEIKLTSIRARSMDNGDIRCPICNLNLQVLSEIKRDEHCDACLDNTGYLEVTSEGKSKESTQLPAKNELQKPEEQVKERKSPTPEKEVSWFFRKRSIEPAAPSKSARIKLEPAAKSPSLSKNSDASIIPSKRLSKMPFYKTLTLGSSIFAVDAFNYGPIPHVNSYFLTHFHSDHYGGLTKSWNHGPIYCSPATARLVNLKLNVSWKYLRPLEIDKEHMIEDVEVKLFDANHCPGAVVFLFNKDILHTGDFRATSELTKNLLDYCSHLDTVYLDTTYLDPNRAFPDQDSVVESCSRYCADLQSRPMPTNYFTTQPKTRRVLVLVGSYTIGKEKLAISIANCLNSKIWAAPSKATVLRAIGDPALDNLLCDNGLDAQVHLISMRDINMGTLESKWKFLKKHYTHLVAFLPTGWTWKSTDKKFTVETLNSPKCTKVINNGTIRVCSVPYSEHSSFSELEAFCKTVACKKLISTVYTKRYDILRSWEKLK